MGILNNYKLVFFAILLVFCTCFFGITYTENNEILPRKLSLEQKIEDRIAQETEMTLDPALGIVPRYELAKARKETKKQLADLIQKSAIPNVVWNERGPNNVGGRTRAIMFDPNDTTNKKVWSGGVGGGLWYSSDITATSANWQNVDDFWSNMAISSMDHDPVNLSVFYVGTGEGWGNSDAIDGDGIWKSTDAGVTWNQLTSTTSFNDCNKIVCFKANKLLVATNNGLRLSNDAGSTWSTVASGSHSDIALSASGDLYASNFSGDIYKSIDDGVTWTIVRNGSGSRVELATAPSDNNYVYAIVASGGSVANILKSVNAGTTWTDVTIPAYKEQNCSFSTTNDFSRGQAWYDLIMLVSPTNKEKLIIGGVDLYRSEDGGTSWETISYWTGGCDAYVHADQHALISRPGFPNEIVSGNDGGVSYSANAFTTGSNPTWNTQNENYNITQFYAVAVHPTAGTTNFLAGAQDNGTKRLTSAGIGGGTNVTGGDGAFCHIDQNEPNNQITSYVYNNYYISSNGSSFPGYSIANDGRFINPTDYDNEGNKLYCAGPTNTYYVIEGIGGTKSHTQKTVTGFGGQVSCVKVSPNTNSTVYFGISGARIAKVTNAASGSPVFTDLGNPSSGYISSIDVEVGNENHILATYSNYGVTSVVESTNGGTTWIGCEGDLPNMPVRWGIFNPNDADQVILGTELGVWTTDNLNGNATDWDPTNSGLANTRVDMIEYRSSDKLMVAATHGRGVFTSESFNFDCLIGTVSIGVQTCNATTNLYTQEITVNLTNTPATGTLNINGQSFSFPTNTASTQQTYTLTNLPANGNSVNLTMQFSAESTCNKTITNAFTAPNAGCVTDNINCSDAFTLSASGTFTTNGPQSGNGCNNCSSATHADWFKFIAPSDGTIEISSCLKGVDTRFWVYEGSCGALISRGGSDDDCAMSQNGNAYASFMTGISVLKDVTYFIEWDNRWSTAGFDFDFTFTGSGCVVTDHLFVDLNADGTGVGCDWANAFDNLQDAIEAAEANTDVTEIWVKSGIYKPGASGVSINRNTSFSTTGNIILLGGFNGTETEKSQRNADLNETILDGDIGVTTVNVDNCLHVVRHSGTNEFGIDGFTIQNGNANLPPDLNGAAVLNSGNLMVKNCILKNNLSTNQGSSLVNSGANANFITKNVNFVSNGPIPFINENGAMILVTVN